MRATGQKEAFSDNVTCFECKKPGHYRNECPSLKKGEKSMRFYKGKKGLVTIGDDSESEEEDSEEEQAAFALMARTNEESEGKCSSEAESDSDKKDEVHSPFSYP